MEQEGLIKERDKLFEKYRNESAKNGKNGLIAFILVCLAFSVILINGAISHSSIKEQTLYTILFIGVFVEGFHRMNWNRKAGKAENAHEFIAIYDKNKRIEKIINFIVLSIFAILLIAWVIYKGSLSSLLILIIGVPLVFFIMRGEEDNRKNEINRLRELTHEIA